MPAEIYRFAYTRAAERRRALREPDVAPYGRDKHGRPDPWTDYEFATWIDLEYERRRKGEHIVPFARKERPAS